MSPLELIKEELEKEIYSDIDKLYEFISSRYHLEKQCNDAMIKKLNELKDLSYKVSKISDLS